MNFLKYRFKKPPLLTEDVSKSIDIDIAILDFLTTYVSKKCLEEGIHPRTLLTSLVSILRKPVAVDLLSFFITHGAATVKVLRTEFPDYSEVAIYRTLEFLEFRGLVVKARPVKTKGRSATMYALRGYSPEEVVRAYERDRYLRTPAYAQVNRIIQFILDDFFPVAQLKGHKEITRGEVMAVIKKMQMGFRPGDLFPLVLKKMREIRVPLSESVDVRPFAKDLLKGAPLTYMGVPVKTGDLRRI